jgi:hypothetical protein
MAATSSQGAVVALVQRCCGVRQPVKNGPQVEGPVQHCCRVRQPVQVRAAAAYHSSVGQEIWERAAAMLRATAIVGEARN